jgi:hypothetical protein
MNDVVPTGNTHPMLALIQRAAADPNFDTTKFQALLDAYSAERKVLAHRAFNEAMTSAATEMQLVPKDAKNDYLHSRYATLPGMLGVIKPVTAYHGLAFRFGTAPHPDPDWMTVTLILSLGDHEEITALSGPILSGEGIRGGKTQMNALQAVGGTVTYLSRYLLGMVFSLIQHMPDIAADDDGGDPTRGPRQSQPASHPPAQHAPPRPPQHATAPTTTGQPVDATAWLKRLDTLLGGCKVLDDIAAVMGRDAIKAWRDGASPAVRADIDALVVTHTARVAPQESTPPESTAMTALLNEISRADQAQLDSLLTTPLFNQAVLGLSFPEQDRIDAAIKARAAELGVAT